MKKIVTVMIMLCLGLIVYCQLPLVDGTPQETPWAANNGFLLKTQVSATTEYSGVTFTYTIFYTIPSGVDASTVITITDVIPAPLKVETTTNPNITISPVDDDLSTPTTVTYTVPAANHVQGTYNFQINVKFPAGTTCNGSIANNYSCMQTSGTTGALILPGLGLLCTNVVTITSVSIENPFWVSMSSPAPVTSSGSSLLYHGVEGVPVEYYLHITSPFVYFGIQNLSNMWVTDVIPINADYVPGSFKITFSNTLINGTAIISSIQQIIVGNEKHVKFLISYLPVDNFNGLITFSLKINYPANDFPAGTILTNAVTYTASSCNNTVTGNTYSVNTILEAASPASLAINSVNLTNPVPGCKGLYRYNIQNTGNTPLCSFSITNQIPQEVVVSEIYCNAYSITPLSGTLTVTNSTNNTLTITIPAINTYWNWQVPSGFGNITNIQFDLGNGLPIGLWYGIMIFFDVGPNIPVGTSISNTINVTYNSNCNIPPTSATATFTIEDYQPKLCVQQGICNLSNSYIYGDIVKYKLIIQNFGSDPLIGATVTDLLDNNLEYIPNSDNYYITHNPSIDCAPNGATIWNGVSVNQNSQEITWNLPLIGSNCQIFNQGCTPELQYYIIEFSARVKQYALAGSIPNYFIVKGGNLPVPVTSHTKYITVNSVFGAQAEKFISIDNGVSWSKTAVVNPGSDVIYRLQFKNTANYPVKNIVFVDMLPKNFSATDDRMILNRNNPNNRGGQFELNYSTILNSPSGTLPYAMINSVPLTSNPIVSVNNDYNICLPELSFSPPGCNSSPVWNLSGTARNVKFEFGQNTSLQPGDILTLDYKVQLPQGSSGLNACNSFALISKGYYYIVDPNGQSTLHIVDPLPTESDLACLSSVSPCNMTLAESHTNVTCPGGSDGTIDLTVNSGTAPYTYSWSNNATTEDLSNLTTGAYSVTVTDAYNCSATTSITIIQEDNIPPTLNCTGDQASCANIPSTNEYKVDGTEFDLPISLYSDNCNVVSVYTTYDNNHLTTLDGQVFPTGTTTVTWTVKDASNNENTCSYDVTVYPIPVATISVSGAEWCNGVELTAIGSPVDNGNIFKWTYPDQTTEILDNIVLTLNESDPGEYNLKVTDAHGCTSASAVPPYFYEPEKQAGSYNLIGFKYVKLGENNTVVNGSIGVTDVNGKAELGKNNVMSGSGSFIKSENIVLHPTATVVKTIYSKAGITLPSMDYYSVTGNSIYSVITVTKNTSPQTIPSTAGYVSVKVEDGAKAILEGSTFGFINIGKDAEVTFTSTSIDVQEIIISSLALGKNPTIAYTFLIFENDASVRVKDRIDIEGYVAVNPYGKNVKFYIGTPNANKKPELDITSDDVSFVGNVYVPDGKIQVHGSPKSIVTTYMRGFFIAETIESNGKNVEWNWFDCWPVGLRKMAEETPGQQITETGINSLNVYPNPFTSMVNINFSVAEKGSVVLEIYNMMGQKISTLYEGSIESGSVYTKVFKPEGLATGMYFVKLTSGAENLIERIILVD